MTDNRYHKAAASWESRSEAALPPGNSPSRPEEEGLVFQQGGHGSNFDQSKQGETYRPNAGSYEGTNQQDAMVTPEGESAGSPGPTEMNLEELTQELELMRAELADTRDRLLRAYAELDNLRKRVARQLEEERRYAELDLLRDLLPVLDDIYRAIEAATGEAGSTSLKEGFRMVAEHLEQVLARHHCYRIDAEGKVFDPNVHEAVGQEPSDSCPPNTVIRVLRAGYRLHDRVVRPAQVIVSRGSAPAPTNN